MNRLVLLISILIGSSGVTIGAEPKLVRVMPLGDSLTQSSPGYRGPLLKRLVAAGHRVEFVGSRSDDWNDGQPLRHEGHGGFTIGPGKSKADAWTDGKGNFHDNLDAWLVARPEIILLLIGTNEFFNVGPLQPGYDLDRQGPARLAGLLGKIHQLSPASLVVVGSILPVAWDANFARGFNAAIPDLVRPRPFARFADLNKTCGWVEGDWSPDQLHPTDRGYAKLAQA